MWIGNSVSSRENAIFLNTHKLDGCKKIFLMDACGVMTFSSSFWDKQHLSMERDLDELRRNDVV